MLALLSSEPSPKYTRFGLLPSVMRTMSMNPSPSKSSDTASLTLSALSEMRTGGWNPSFYASSFDRIR